MNLRFELEREIKRHRDVLVERSQELIDANAGIEKTGGLTTTQIHNLLHTAWSRRTLSSIQHFIHQQMERSAEGEAWKFGGQKTDSGESGKYFGDRLIAELYRFIADIAQIIVANERIGYDLQNEVEMKLAREFLTYLAWYFIHRQNEATRKGGNTHV